MLAVAAILRRSRAMAASIICRRLPGKVALVTGAAAGIGKSIAFRLASEGAHVCVVDRAADGAETVANEIKKLGLQASFLECDVSSTANIKDTVESFASQHGLDILVNNAAAFHFASLEDTTDDDWMRLLKTNLLGYSNSIKFSVPFLKNSAAPNIVNVASVSSFIAQPEMFVYNSTKGAIAQLTRCLAMDLAKDKIRVNAVAPGSIATPAAFRHMDAIGLSREEGRVEFGKDALMKRMAEPEEIASVVAFLASEDASFMTGSLVVADGGATLD